MNIIDTILSDQDIDKEPESEIQSVTAESFFTEDSKDGICSKKQFLDLLKTCDRNDLKALEHVLQLMNQDQKFDVSPFQRVDSKGRQYVWVSLNKRRTTGGYKVLTNDELAHLMNLYGFNLIKCSLSLEALYQKALN